MTWFLRSRQAALLIAVAVLSTTGTIAAARWYAPFPVIATPAGLGVPVAMALPVLTGLAVIGGLRSPSPDIELSATRSTTSLDTVVLLTMLLATAVPMLVTGAWSTNWLLIAGGRNVAAVVGLGLVLRRWISPTAATLIPVVHAVACFSVANRVEPQAWAWLVLAPTSTWASMVAVGFLTAGATLGLNDRARLRQLHWAEAD